MLDRLQIATGLRLKDIALLVGGLALVAGVLLLGVSGNSPDRRWLARIGWLFLMGSAVTLGYGTVGRSQSHNNAQAN